MKQAELVVALVLPPDALPSLVTSPEVTFVRD
jgi:hypothetical protein